ncbi:MAG: hypothetical protein IT370_21580 [Deltaproteobacteria bacterium]|nr:hypothetical protein [Deltaproteobacteria bacterium]
MRIALLLAPAVALSLLATAGCSHAPRRVEETNLGYLDDEAVRGAPATARPVVPSAAGSIERAELERVLAAGPAPVLAEYELGADLLGGRFQGWTIKAAVGTRFAAVDLRVGDVVRSVNGRSLERPGDLFTVWETLHGASELVIGVSRGASMHTLRYTIVGEPAPVVEVPAPLPAPAAAPGARETRMVPAPREIR